MYAYSCILYPELSHAFPIAPSRALWQFVSPVIVLPANLTQMEQGFLSPSSLSPSSGQLLTLLACLLWWLIFFQVTIKLHPNFKRIKQGPLWTQRMKAWVRHRVPDGNHVLGKLRQEDHRVQGQPELIANESRLIVKSCFKKKRSILSQWFPHVYILPRKKMAKN